MTATLTLGTTPGSWADHQARRNAQLRADLLDAARVAHETGQQRAVETRLYGCRIVLVPEPEPAPSGTVPREFGSLPGDLGYDE